MSVEDLDLYAFFAKHIGQDRGFVDGPSPDQYGASLFMDLEDFLNDGLKFLGHVMADYVREPFTSGRAIGGDLYHRCLVDPPKLAGTGRSGSRHTS